MRRFFYFWTQPVKPNHLNTSSIGLLKSILISLILLLTGVSSAQFSKDTARVNRWNDLSKEASPGNFDQAVKYADSAIRLARRIDYLEGYGYGVMFKGLAHDYAGNFDQAVVLYDSAAHIQQKAGSDIGYGTAINNIGIAYIYTGKYDDAASYLLRSMPYFKKAGHSKGIAATLNNLGMISRSRGDYTKALDYYEESILYKKRIGDVRGELTTMTNIVAIYIFLEDWKQALEWNSRCIRLTNQEGEEGQNGENYTNQAFILHGMGREKEAKDYFHRAFPLLISNSYNKSLAMGYAGLALVYLGEKATDSAKVYLDKATVLLDSVENVTVRLEVLEGYASYYEMRKDFAKAFEFEKQYVDLFREVSEASGSDKIKELEAKYNYLAQKERIDALNRDNEIIRLEQEQSAFNQRVLMIAIVAVLLILAYIVFLYRSVRKQKERASDALKENELLMREIHHRVKNNLQLVSSLLYLQSQEIDDHAALKAITVSRTRVEAMAVIHQKLYGERAVLDLSASEYIDDLIGGIFDSLQLDEEHWEIRKDIDPLALDIDTTIPIALILNELITNSLKHSGGSGETLKHLEITLKKDGEYLLLRVADNGPGGEGNSKYSTGFGSRLVEMLAKKLRAEIAVSKENGYSTELRITKFTLKNE